MAIVVRTLDLPWINRDIAHTVYAISFVWIAAWVAIRGVDLASYLILRRRNAAGTRTLDVRTVETQVNILRRLVTALIVLVAIASALMSFDSVRSLGASLLASAGVAGVVLGLAAQKTMGNFFTGLQIAVAQPVRLGDNIIVENDFATVEEINLTYVVVRTWDLRRLILPINYFVEKPFQNWSRQTTDLLTDMRIWVDFLMPLKPLRGEFERLLGNTQLWNGKVKSVAVTDANATAMQVRFLASADDPGRNSDLQNYLREGIITFIRDHYPQHFAHSRYSMESDAQSSDAPPRQNGSTPATAQA